MTFTQADLEAALHALGLETDDAVIVHSSLSSIGWVEGGADAVVDALLAVVGDEGTIAMPTFTFGSVPFDRARTPSRTGAITEALRTHPEAERSPHPTHSVVVVGPDAAAVTADHDYLETFGTESPLYRLINRGAKILLIGVDNRRNSSIHLAEQLAKVPHKQRTREAPILDADGSTRIVEIASPECGRGFDAIEPAAERARILHRGSIGDASVQLLDGRALLSCAVGVLATDPGALLCDSEGCDSCDRGRRLLADASR